VASDYLSFTERFYVFVKSPAHISVVQYRSQLRLIKAGLTERSPAKLEGAFYESVCRRFGDSDWKFSRSALIYTKLGCLWNSM